MMAFLLALFLGVVLLEVPGLIRKRMWGELAAFSVYLLIGVALCIPQLLGVRLPNPTKAIEALFRPMAELLRVGQGSAGRAAS